MNAAVGLTAGLGLDGDRCIRVIPRQYWPPPPSHRLDVIFTARNEVAKVMFLHVSVSHSVHRGRCLSTNPRGKLRSLAGGRGCLGQHPGGKLRGLALRGVSRPTPGGGVCPGGKFELTVFELTMFDLYQSSLIRSENGRRL